LWQPEAEDSATWNLPIDVHFSEFRLVDLDAFPFAGSHATRH